MKRFALIIALLTAIVSPALACPLCDSETAEETRAGILNDEFFPTLFAGILPFVIVAGIALAVHIDWSRIGMKAPSREGQSL